MKGDNYFSVMRYDNLKEYIKKLVLEELNEIKIGKVHYDKNVIISLYAQFNNYWIR